MPKLTIDGKEVEVDKGLTVLQACEAVGIEVPRFCYHERLSIAGNCRMCLVEMERAPRPVAACAMPVADGMIIKTDTEKVRKMRRSVMEFLLINHPLDCPICDQGGECDLQDLAVSYGMDRGRYGEDKRAVPDHDYGPLVRTVMTRCIHCTRCIRFVNEIAGVPVLGGTFRGEHLEVGAYVERAIDSELSGNLIDVCPVGALTSKPYQFRARPWELRKTESVDVLDAVGSNIRVDVRGAEVMRILPRLNEDVNEEWISDKTRFACDGLKRQRLDTPYVRDAQGKLQPAAWDEAFAAIATRLKGLEGGKIAAIAGDLADCESMLLLKDLMASLGSPNLDCRQDGAALDASCRAGYLFNATIAGIEQADACLIVGSIPRTEAPIVNARLRKRYLQGGFKVGVVGPEVDLTYKYEHLGEGPAALKSLGAFAEVLKAAERPMLILGQGALRRPDGAAILAECRALAESFGMVKDGWNGFSVLHTAAARVGGLDLGFVPGPGGLGTEGILKGAESGAVEAVYLLNADEIDMARLKKAFVIYQGHHGDAGAAAADVILPGAAHTEKDATYVNTEGRPQRTRRALFPPGEAREDWAVLRALSDALGHGVAGDTVGEVRQRLADANPVFAATGRAIPAAWGDFGTAGALGAEPFQPAVANFYMTDPISRCSPTMASCTAAFRGGKAKGTGTDG
ncbi:MAG: NADH-quinone oxidoreductase subunit NuoG [Magnetospirillum sp. WYHS-4]